MQTYQEHRQEQAAHGRVEVTVIAAADTDDVVVVVGTNGISHGRMYFVRKDDDRVQAWQRNAE